jgi:hypothetical protein
LCTCAIRGTIAPADGVAGGNGHLFFGGIYALVDVAFRNHMPRSTQPTGSLSDSQAQAFPSSTDTAAPGRCRFHCSSTAATSTKPHSFESAMHISSPLTRTRGPHHSADTPVARGGWRPLDDLVAYRLAVKWLACWPSRPRSAAARHLRGETYQVAAVVMYSDARSEPFWGSRSRTRRRRTTWSAPSPRSWAHRTPFRLSSPKCSRSMRPSATAWWSEGAVC